MNEKPDQPDQPRAGDAPSPDPLAWWQQFFEAARPAAPASSEAAAEAFQGALNRSWQHWLDLQLQAQRQAERSLDTLNMPSRADVARIAEQVVALELKIDDLDARLDGFVALAAQVRALDAKLDQLLALVTPEDRAGGEAPGD